VWKRITLGWQVGRCNLQLRRDRRREAKALLRLGEGVSGLTLVGQDDEAKAAVSALAAAQGKRRVLDEALHASLETDRSDYAAVPRWAQGAVVLRGLLDRALLRTRVRRVAADLRAAQTQVGLLAATGRVLAAGPGAAPGAAPVSPDQASALNQLWTQTLAAEQSKAALLGQLGGRVFPAWLDTAAREGAGLAAAIGREAYGKFLPRLPALAGMAVGWWVAHAYTDSHVDAVLSRVGLRKGGTHVISSERLQSLAFWLPLVVGASCSYLSARLSAAIEARYGAAARTAPEVESTAGRDLARTATVLSAAPPAVESGVRPAATPAP
jgi:hypothetical protein